jgi:hypothetical protein
MKPPTVSDMQKKYNVSSKGLCTSNRFSVLESEDKSTRHTRGNRLDSVSDAGSSGRSASQKRKAEEKGESTGAIPKKLFVDDGRYSTQSRNTLHVPTLSSPHR